MSKLTITVQFDGDQTRSNSPSENCKITKDELRSDGFKYTEDCPICRDHYQILCIVACHPTNATGDVFFLPSNFITFIEVVVKNKK